MLRTFARFIASLFSGKKRGIDIDPDETFLDSSNLPEFDTSQLEGRIVRPVSKRSIAALGIFFILVGFVFGARAWTLQVARGGEYAQRSEENRIRPSILFAERGVIYDRRGTELAWNTHNEESDRGEEMFAFRAYTDLPGLAHVLGYVSYPQKDAAGFFFQDTFVGTDGAERIFDREVGGENGLKLTETNARFELQSEGIVHRPEAGKSITLSVDAELTSALFEIIQNTAEDVGFTGGAGAIMDIETGELIALTSFPEYDSAVLSRGEPKETIDAFRLDAAEPFLNRMVSGLYTPGSIVKPYVALAALSEGVIDPAEKIVSTGRLVIPNPYFPDRPSIFVDWKVHGAVDMRRALAVSSNVYFYAIGGGLPAAAAAQAGSGAIEGAGITKLEKYFRLFRFDEPTESALGVEPRGVIPSPEWKQETFGDDPWRLGDTYNTAIGQYGFQITPLQALRGIAAVAAKGKIVSPTLLENNTEVLAILPIEEEHFAIVHEGMRQAVLEGTAQGLSVPYVSVAAKTGTAELDSNATSRFVNSWITGFFPYENPRYAFVVVMEEGPRRNLIGGVSVMRRLFDWMRDNRAEYFESEVVGVGD